MEAVAEYRFHLPELWHQIPVGATDDAWAVELAGGLLGDGEPPVPDAVTLLAQQFLDVSRAVAGMGVSTVQAAVLVADPASVLVDAMLTLSFQRGVPVETYQARLNSVVDEIEQAQIMGKQDIQSEVPSGQVHGAHLLIGHLPVEEFTAGSLLEERVQLGLFPHGTGDVVDLVVVAANTAFFEDLPTTALDLLGRVEIETETVA
ncbi:hypothetical protein [Promicromonospora aerolata]|uniref:Uncharacterized protein n=1 Tax=Promicromonospora aerolata TaxID=195749 RepID=A0ABW4V9Z9_9MICO